MGASSEPVRPPCLDLPSSSLQLRTCALEGGTRDRRHPRPSGVHLRPACVSGALAPARFTHPGPARRSRARARGRAPAPPELHARLAGPPPRPSALPPSRSPSRQPVTPLQSSTPIGRHHAARPSLPPVGPFPARGGASAARTGPRGRRPGWAGGAGRVTWAGGRWSAGAGRRGAAGGHFGGHGRPPPGPARGAARESILWPQPPASSVLRRHLCPHPFLPFTYLRMNRLALPSLLQKTSVSPAPRRQSLLHLGFSPNLSQNPNVGFSGLYKSFSSRVPCSP